MYEHSVYYPVSACIPVFAHPRIHAVCMPIWISMVCPTLAIFPLMRACVMSAASSISIVLCSSWRVPPPHHCRHTLAKPKVWKLGATETISLTIYDWQYTSRFIEAILYVRVCTCVYRRRFRRRCREDRIITTRVQASPGT